MDCDDGLVAEREPITRRTFPKAEEFFAEVDDPEALLQELGEPMLSTSAQLPGEILPLVDAAEIRERLEKQLDLVIDGGACGVTPSTVVDLTLSPPGVLREGLGVWPS